MRFGTTCLQRFSAASLPLLLAACAAAPAPVAEPPPAPRAETTVAPANAAEEPLPAHWLGVFTMVEMPTGTAGRGQFQLRLGEQGPNHFYARRGCYIRDGWLKRRGDQWLVEPRGAVRADERCLADPNAFKGFPAGLFEHRAIMLSPPGERHWIAESGGRWAYLPNPAAAPLSPPAPREPQLPVNADIAEALYRHQIARDAVAHREVAALCLGVGARADLLSNPPAEILARFAGHRPTVKGVGACSWDDSHWIDAATGGRAIVYYVAELVCPSATRCTARGGYIAGNLSASSSRYLLERRDGRWQVTGDTVEAIS